MFQLVTRISTTITLMVVLGLGVLYSGTLSTKRDLAHDELDQLFERLIEEESAPSYGGLGDFLEELNRVERALRENRNAPVINISDRRYDGLNRKWRQGIAWLLTTGRCDRFDHIVDAVAKREGINFLLAKAQMIVESSCRTDAVSSADAHGLFQLKEIACVDVGLEGDLFDPAFNAECASEYRLALCERYERCALPDMLVAYNMGPTGSTSVEDARAHFYTRKIQFVWEALRAAQNASGSRA